MVKLRVWADAGVCADGNEIMVHMHLVTLVSEPLSRNNTKLTLHLLHGLIVPLV